VLNLRIGLAFGVHFEEKSNLDSARTEKFGAKGSRQMQKEEVLKDAEDYNQLFEEMKQKLDKDFKDNKLYVRDWHSFDESVVRDKYSEMGPCSSFESEQSRQSFPLRTTCPQMKDPEYLARLELFRERLKSKYQYNNIYFHRAGDPEVSLMEAVACRRTQTYEREVFNQADLFHLLDDDTDEEVEDLELDPNYIGILLKGIVEKLSENDLDSLMSDEVDDNFEWGGFGKKKRKRNMVVDLDEIIGSFEIDDFGNIVLNRELMRDNFNRQVNKHGYLIDERRNVINQEGSVIFEADELDSDEDLPMPFKFEVRKKQLLKSQDKFKVDPDQQILADEDNVLQMEEEKVEEEMVRLQSLTKYSSPKSNLMASGSKLEGKDSGDEDEEEEEEDEDRLKKKSPFSKKEIRLAKAYGGAPKASP